MTQDRNNLSPSEALVLILIVLVIGGSCSMRTDSDERDETTRQQAEQIARLSAQVRKLEAELALARSAGSRDLNLRMNEANKALRAERDAAQQEIRLRPRGVPRLATGETLVGRMCILGIQLISVIVAYG